MLELFARRVVSLLCCRLLLSTRPLDYAVGICLWRLVAITTFFLRF